MFIDFHTHCDRQDPNLLNLQTLHVTPELNSEDLPIFCSVGLHPWFIESGWEKSWANLELLARSPQVIAIGECGLDRLISLSMEVQIAIFQKQIELAEALHKPLVIHCVKAFAELIELKKKTQPSVPWIIHGFNKKREVLEQLLHYDFYFSFGAAILSDRSPLQQAIATIPDGKFLLETDDRHDLSVQQIYERVASLRQVPLTTLQAQLLEAYHQLTRLI